jgi:hypothetical protein
MTDAIGGLFMRMVTSSSFHVLFLSALRDDGDVSWVRAIGVIGPSVSGVGSHVSVGQYMSNVLVKLGNVDL